MPAGFELTSRADSQVVGLNLVMLEDALVPMRDFSLHTRLLDYLHGVYLQVQVTLHAGELAPGLVPPKGLRFHIRESIQRGHAARIGHGVAICWVTEGPVSSFSFTAIVIFPTWP